MRKLIIASVTALAIAIATIPLGAIGGLPGFGPAPAYATGSITSAPTSIALSDAPTTGSTTQVTLTATLDSDISNYPGETFSYTVLAYTKDGGLLARAEEHFIRTGGGSQKLPFAVLRNKIAARTEAKYQALGGDL